MLKGHLFADVGKILVPFHNLGLVSREVRTHETEGGRVEEESDSHTPFVPSLSGQTCLHSTNSNVSTGSHDKHMIHARLHDEHMRSQVVCIRGSHDTLQDQSPDVRDELGIDEDIETHPNQLLGCK